MSSSSQVSILDLAHAAKVAEENKDWTLAIEQWDACLKAFPKHADAPRWNSARAFALEKLGYYAEAENIYRSLLQALPDKPLGLSGLARIAQVQKAWSLALQRWDACIQRFPAHTDVARWRGSRATVLERLDMWEEAFKAWDTLAGESGGNRPALMGRARCLLQCVGPTEEVEQSVAKVLAAFPQDSAALRLHARIAAQRDDFRAALDRWIKYFELQPRDDIDAYEAVIRNAKRCADTPAVTRIVENAPRELSNTAAFRYRVLLPFCKLREDIDAGQKLLSNVNGEEIGWREALAIGEFLNDIQRFEESAVFLGKMLERFRGNRQLTVKSLPTPTPFRVQ